MFRAVIFAALAMLAFASSSYAQSGSTGRDEHESQGRKQDRLMIVNGNNGYVLYDDGRDDLFCVTRRYVAYYDQFGRPVFRRTMRCR